MEKQINLEFNPEKKGLTLKQLLENIQEDLDGYSEELKEKALNSQVSVSVNDLKGSNIAVNVEMEVGLCEDYVLVGNIIGIH